LVPKVVHYNILSGRTSHITSGRERCEKEKRQTSFKKKRQVVRILFWSIVGYSVRGINRTLEKRTLGDKKKEESSRASLQWASCRNKSSLLGGRWGGKVLYHQSPGGEEGKLESRLERKEGNFLSLRRECPSLWERGCGGVRFPW